MPRSSQIGWLGGNVALVPENCYENSELRRNRQNCKEEEHLRRRAEYGPENVRRGACLSSPLARLVSCDSGVAREKASNCRGTASGTTRIGRAMPTTPATRCPASDSADSFSCRKCKLHLGVDLNRSSSQDHNMSYKVLSMAVCKRFSVCRFAQGKTPC